MPVAQTEHKFWRGAPRRCINQHLTAFANLLEVTNRIQKDINPLDLEAEFRELGSFPIAWFQQPSHFANRHPAILQEIATPDRPPELRDSIRSTGAPSHSPLTCLRCVGCPTVCDNRMLPNQVCQGFQSATHSKTGPASTEFHSRFDCPHFDCTQTRHPDGCV